MKHRTARDAILLFLPRRSASPLVEQSVVKGTRKLPEEVVIGPVESKFLRERLIMARSIVTGVYEGLYVTMIRRTERGVKLRDIHPEKLLRPKDSYPHASKGRS